MISVASCMRSALIHPVLPSGGRDITVMFSPTRRKMPSVLSAQERPNTCVCCHRKLRIQATRKTSDAKKEKRVDGYENLNDNQVEDEDDALFVEDDHHGSKGWGKIVPIEQPFCRLAEHGLRHFACESCLEEMKAADDTCPLCQSLMRRLKIDSGPCELSRIKQESIASETGFGIVRQREGFNLQPEDMEVPRVIYSPGINGGFRASGTFPTLFLFLPRMHPVECIKH